MVGVEIVKNKNTKEPAAEISTEVRKLCANHGLVVGIGGWWSNVIRIQPPLTIREDHIDQALETLEKAVKEIST